MQQQVYTLGLRTSELMEQSDWCVEDIRHIAAGSLRAAKDKYAEVLGLKKSAYWNSENQTYWGWKIVEV